MLREKLSNDVKTKEKLSNDVKTKEKLSNDLKTKEKLLNDLKTKEKLSNDMRFENKSFPAQGFPPCRAVKYQEVAGAAARRKNYLQS